MLLQQGDEPIPGYRLEKFLGRGQFGQVWRASSPGKTSLALKFLDLSGKPGRKEFRAIQRVKQIRHAHLMPIVALWLLDKEGRVLDDDVLDGFSEESSLVTATLDIADAEEPADEPATLVVAQLLADKTLGDRLEECLSEGLSGIPAKELLVYMEETARGIDFLNTARHDLGAGRSAIQHCDIKPANLLLSGDSVLVTDYGVAQVLAAGTSARATGMVGSPAYMAPECIAQKPSPASDQYSLAVSYVELRTGKLPFAGETFTEVLDAHRQGKLDLSGLPPAEAAVIRKATAIAPSQRYSTAQEMVEALRVAVHPPEKPPSSARGRNSWLLVAAVTLVACGFVWLMVERNGSPPIPAAVERTFEIRVSPEDALVEIDGTPVEPTSGVYRIERTTADEIVIRVQKSPEFTPVEERIPLVQYAGGDPILIQLAPHPDYYAERAWQNYDAGNLEQAVQDFATAVKHDTLGRFQQVPAASHQYSYDDDGPIHRAAVSPDGRWLLTWGGRDVLRLWDLSALPSDSSRTNLHASQPGRDSCTLALSNQWAAIAYASSGELFTIPVSEAGKNARLQLASGLIEAHLTRDNRWLITSSAGSGTGLEYQLQRWDLQADEPQGSAVELGRREQLLLSLAVSPDSQYLVTGDVDGTVTRYTLTDPAAPPVRLMEEAGDVTCLLALPGFVAAAGEIKVEGDFAQGADVGDAYRVAVLKDGSFSLLPIGHALPIRLLATDSSHRWLASASEDNQLHVWDTQSWLENQPSNARPAVLASAHASVVQQLGFDATGRWLICAGGDGHGSAERVIMLWDFATANSSTTLELRGRMGAIKAVTVTPDHRWLVVCGERGVWVWDFRRCTLLKRVLDQSGRPTPGSVPPSPTGLET